MKWLGRVSGGGSCIKVVEDPLMLGRMDGVQIGPGFEPVSLAKISQTAK